MHKPSPVHRFTRQELYDLVWSTPIRNLGPQHGISDVAFAKSCRDADIPLPPRGYWAQTQAGKKAPREPLPPRGVGMGEVVEIGGGANRWGSYGTPPNLLEMEIPPAPVFPEPISAVRQRVAARTGKVPISKTFEKAHRLIAGLLAEDEKRRQKQLASRYPSMSDAPRFESPFERRRLRLLSAIFTALEKAGHRPALQGRDRSQFDARIGSQRVEFFLDHPGQKREGYGPASAANRPATDVLKLEISPWRKSGEVPLLWEDTKDSLIEDHVDAIIVSLIVAGEVQYRQSEIEHVAWLKERKANLVEELRKQKEEAERREREQRIKTEKARVDRLLGEADALRQSQAIRSYVAMVRAQNAGASLPLSADKIEAWAAWALAQADRIDPVLTGKFLTYEADDFVRET